MGRHKKVVKSVNKHIMIPEDLVARVELELWSEVEGKVPHGAWQELVAGALKEWLEKRVAARHEQAARDAIARQRQALGLKFSSEV